MDTTNWENQVESRIQEILYEAIGVKKEVQEKSLKLYMMEPNKRATYEEQI